AHESTRRGGVSEALAHAMFLANGFSVFTSVVPESADLIVVGKGEDGKNRTFTVQVKTLKIRRDREGHLVVKGASSDGLAYSIDEVDYILGVHFPTHTAFLIQNNCQTDYCLKNWDTATKKWTKFKLSFLIIST